MIRERTIKADLKRYRVYWFVMLLLFTIFVIVVVRTVHKTNEQEIAEIMAANVISAKREAQAKADRDSAKVQRDITNKKLEVLQNNLNNTNNAILRMENDFSNSYEQLIKFKLDEKQFVNPNASPTEQFIYVSGYRHKEF